MTNSGVRVSGRARPRRAELVTPMPWDPARRGRALLIAALVLVAAACASRPTAGKPKPSLREFIDQQIGTSPYDRGVWGVRVEDEKEHVLYERNSEVLMVPASNRKTFVAALASYCLGLDATFETELWLDGVQRDSVLDGDLVVRGGGDPSLGGRFETDRDRRLMPFLEALRHQGIVQVTGGIVADPSRFDRERLLGSWEIEDIGTSNASPVDALTFNEGIVGVLVDGCSPNSVTLDPSFPEVSAEVECGEQDRIAIRSDEGNRVLVTGSVKAPRETASYQALLSVSDPALYAAMAVDDFLRRNGILIESAPTVTLTPRGSERLAAVVSPPLFALLASYMEESINLWGDVILKNLSAGSSPGSFAGSLREEERFLTEIVGIEASAFEFADGSGLSTRNKVTAAAIVRLLRFMDRSPMRGAFREMFAEPGELGTMRTRLTDLKGRLLVKTGTINGVRALSGMVAGVGGQTRYFSILVNHYSEDLPLAREPIDAIVRMIAEVSDE